mmetsp:Transcript_18115/g.42311  ORF Transcript_18115/g.42311 Transcript_18115/m.42311 type:complete len:177 (-) Transcript_18115:97-627(-)|eukprot:CAMPEP_0178432336 /NCGR_PEP_ID=MMETSP0689_2-20121128/32328_1 /TAXON_ID=160604 /ORGANISM="Amphidinium massartii, Strain CS-259" /LENGTH=176 /DNA_ID=CAMNT_0020054311 /DNA_START=72 /DNA_END=602 /DNA_ORIENTATION=+
MVEKGGEELRLFLRNAEGLQEHHIEDYFKRFGDVQNVNLIRDKKTKRPRGLAYVTVKVKDGGEAITERDSHTINNVEVEVQEALPQEKPDNEEAAAGDVAESKKEESGDAKSGEAPGIVAAATPSPADAAAEAQAKAQWQMHYLAMAINASVPDMASVPPPAARPGKGGGHRSRPY